jgi:VWFA-related protein
MNTRYLAATLVLAALVAAPAAQQAPQTQPRPGVEDPGVTFRVEVNYVEVDAAVFDRQGRFLGDLQRSDFQVFEDGQPQDITAFTLVNIPVEPPADQPLFARTPIPADVASNERPFEGRLYVLVLDDLHTASYRTARVRAAARQFIERHMAANDMAAVIHTSGQTNAAQDFTSRKALLLDSVDRFVGRKIRSSTLERLDEYQRQRGMPRSSSEISRIQDPRDMERGYDARNALDTLRNISDWVGNIRGRRKAIVWLSEGIDYNIYDFNNREASSIQDRMREVIASATRSNVSIYAVDPRGLTAMGDDSIEASGGFPEDPQLGLSMQSFQDEVRLAQMNLRSLAEDTGGYAAVNANDFTGAFQRVVGDNSSYYVLGYYPSNDRRDGRFRKIEVRVNRPGVEVRSRKGYTAPRGKPAAPSRTPTEDKTSPELRQALDSPLPLTGVTLRAFAAPFRGTAPNASVAVGIEADGTDINFVDVDGKFVNDFELSVIALDASGKVRGGDRNLVNMGLKADTRQRVVEHGLRMQTRLEVPPGRYQLRAAARESGAGRIGSVTFDLVVPDFSKETLAMSGVVIAAASTQHTLTAKADEELRTLLPAPVTARREFPSGDMLAVFAEVYDNEPRTQRTIEISTAVVDDTGRTVFKTSEERSSRELQGKAGGYGHSAQVPLAGLAPGLYVLRVEAMPRAGSREPIVREVPFRIR